MAEASATSVATSNQKEQESLEIIDLDELDLEFQDDETWLVSPTPELEKSPDQAISPSWRKWNMYVVLITCFHGSFVILENNCLFDQNDIYIRQL